MKTLLLHCINFKSKKHILLNLFQSSEPGTQESNPATETLGVGGALHGYVAVYFFFLSAS